jgi:hypothetical protein
LPFGSRMSPAFRDEPGHRPRHSARRRLGTTAAFPAPVWRNTGGVRRRDRRDHARDIRHVSLGVRGHAPLEEPDWSLGKVLAALATTVLDCAVPGLVITVAWLYTRIETDHAAAVARCAVDSARMDEQAAEARCRCSRRRSSRTSCSTRSRTSSVSTKPIARPARG